MPCELTSLTMKQIYIFISNWTTIKEFLAKQKRASFSRKLSSTLKYFKIGIKGGYFFHHNHAVDSRRIQYTTLNHEVIPFWPNFKCRLASFFFTQSISRHLRPSFVKPCLYITTLTWFVNSKTLDNLIDTIEF